METILTLILFMANLLFGYILGRKAHPEDVLEQSYNKAKGFVDNLGKSKYVGAVKRPSAQALYNKQDPQRKAADEEMAKAFEELGKEE